LMRKADVEAATRELLQGAHVGAPAHARA